MKLDTRLPFGRYTHLITKLHLGALTKRLEHLGIDRYYSVLMMVESAKCCQGMLAEMLRIDKASMVRQIDYLMKEGLLVREPNPEDRREHLIRLTEKGRALMPEIRKAVAEINDAMLSGLDETQRQMLFGFMETMMENLENLPRNSVSLNYKKAK